MDRRARIVELVRALVLERRDEPFTLTSGEVSYEYVDAKLAIARGSDLETAAVAGVDALAQIGVPAYEAVGGMTMGADPLAHAIAMVADVRWFSVRKQPKGHGTQRSLEGGRLDPGTPVVLVDDVVTTGGSIQQAYNVLDDLGIRVVGALTLVDRGDVAGAFFSDREVPYVALATYRDLDIPPVGATA